MGPMPAHSTLKFGPFEVDPSSGRAAQGRGTHPDPGKTVASAHCPRGAAGRSGHAGRVAPATVARRNLRRLRHRAEYRGAQAALRAGRRSESPRYIETLPKRGYRFLATVEFVNGAAGAQADLGKDPHRYLLPRRDHKTGRLEAQVRDRAPRAKDAALAWADRSSHRGHAGYRERRGRVAHL